MRSALGLILIFLIPGLALVFVDLCKELLAHENLVLSVGGGFILGCALDATLLRRIPGFDTFEHELTHATVGLMFLRKINRFVVTRQSGGMVQHSGGFGGELGSELIGMAPYYLPTFSFLLVLPRPWILISWFPWYDLSIGATLGFHVLSTIRETRRSWTPEVFTSAGTGEYVQSDIGRRGFVYSFVFIVARALTTHNVVLGMIVGGYGELMFRAKEVWSTTGTIVLFLTTAAGKLLHSLSG
jgi:hypothetical protein